MPTLRVVLDTNVLVPGLVYRAGNPHLIVRAWDRGAIKVVLSRHILDEVARVLPRFDRILNWKPSQYADLVDFLAMRVELVEPAELPDTAVRDLGDVPVLGTLLGAKADYLITGDKDLLALAGRYAILTPAEFWRKHGA